MKFLRSITLFSLALSPFALGFAEDRSLTEFASGENTALDWRIVDDGVMGGLSRGRVSFTDGGTLRFAGDLSLENNGGFSSVRTKTRGFDLGDCEGLAMRVKGDGRNYELRLNTDARYGSGEVSFKAAFPTTKGEWREVKVPFTNFVAGWRGRTLETVFDPAKIQRVGLLLGDKKPGPFQLEVDWIRAYGVSAAEEGRGDLVETAAADGRFKTLASALTKSELVAALQGEGPLTVFAPTDAAFAKLPKEALAELLEPSNKEKLQAVLKYHVVSGRAKLSDALKAGEVATLQGNSLNVAFSNGQVRVEQAALVAADVECSNGVIHVIDAVLLPPSYTASGGSSKEASASATSPAAAERKGAAAQRRILTAIDKGVPLYNQGDPEACAKVYAECVESLVKDKQVTADVRRVLAEVLNKAAKTRGDDARAWLLRRTLDGALAHLQPAH